MTKRELTEKIEQALDMVISVGGRRFRILRDKEDRITISEKQHGETAKCYTDTNQLITRYRINGKTLREYLDAITIVKYTPLLDMR